MKYVQCFIKYLDIHWQIMLSAWTNFWLSRVVTRFLGIDKQSIFKNVTTVRTLLCTVVVWNWPVLPISQGIVLLTPEVLRDSARACRQFWMNLSGHWWFEIICRKWHIGSYVPMWSSLCLMTAWYWISTDIVLTKFWYHMYWHFNSLAPGDLNVILKCNLQSCFTDWYLQISLW